MTNGPIQVNCIKLDTVIETYLTKLGYDNSSSIDILSIDVDGSEKFVLDGFSINKYTPKIIIIEHTTPGNFKYISDYLKSNDYKIVFITPSSYIAIHKNINNYNENYIRFHSNNKLEIPSNSKKLKKIYEFVKSKSILCKVKHQLDR